MNDIIFDLRGAACVHASNEPLAALLRNAAAEIERLRGGPIVLDKSPKQQVAVSYSELVKNMKHRAAGDW